MTMTLGEIQAAIAQAFPGEPVTFRAEATSLPAGPNETKVTLWHKEAGTVKNFLTLEVGIEILNRRLDRTVNHADDFEVIEVGNPKVEGSKVETLEEPEVGGSKIESQNVETSEGPEVESPKGENAKQATECVNCPQPADSRYWLWGDGGVRYPLCKKCFDWINERARATGSTLSKLLREHLESKGRSPVPGDT